MRTQQKIKKEYSADDTKFPLNDVVAMALIQTHGTSVQKVAENAGLNRITVDNWIHHRNFAPRRNVLRVFGPLGINEDNLSSLVIPKPSDALLKKLSKGILRKREINAKRRSQQPDNDFDFEEFADQLINLSQVVNQVDQRQKEQSDNWATLFTMLNKISEDQAKQQSYLVNEIRSLRKEVQQKNVLIRELHR